MVTSAPAGKQSWFGALRAFPVTVYQAEQTTGRLNQGLLAQRVYTALYPKCLDPVDPSVYKECSFPNEFS